MCWRIISQLVGSFWMLYWRNRRILGYCLWLVFGFSLCKVGRNVCTKKCLQKRGRSWFNWKSIWVLRKKIHFEFTTRMKEGSFQNLQNTMNFISNVKFPVIVAVRGTFACYHHVIVVWNNVVYDYESKNGYPLTNETVT